MLHTVYENVKLDGNIPQTLFTQTVDTLNHQGPYH